MIDSLSMTARHEGYYQYGENIYPLDAALGDRVVGRPGHVPIGSVLGGGPVQGIYQFVKRNGTVFTIGVSAGEVYTLNWATFVWTLVLTTANLTGAAITMDASQPVQILTYTDKVVFNDGVNTPWAWDGTSGAGLTKMTNAPAFAAGTMAVYNGRLLGFKLSDPTTFVWSETDTLNTGYEAGGFNNAWTFVQTDQSRGYAILATNDGIVVLRARSATEITGTVTQNWSSFGSREGLSEEIGTRSPFAALYYGNGIVLLDADMQPQFLRLGGAEAVPVWPGFRETIKTLLKTSTAALRAKMVHFTPASLLLIAVSESAGSASSQNIMLVLEAKNGATPVPVAIWRSGLVWAITAMAMVSAGPVTSSPVATADSRILLFGAFNGQVYLIGDPANASCPFADYDTFAGAATTIEHCLKTQALGYDDEAEKVFDRIDVVGRNGNTLLISPYTPNTTFGSVVEQSIALSGPAANDDVHGEVGISEEGRWIQVQVRHANGASSTEQFSLSAIAVDAFVSDAGPEVP
jgi:hypothetical protein